MKADDAIASTAAGWVMRLDRGLTPEEQDQYLQWLAADARHGEAMAQCRRTWETFNRLAGLQAAVEALPDPDLLAPVAAATRSRPSRRLRWLVLPVGLAAAIALVWRPLVERPPIARAPAGEVGLAAAQLAPIEERQLEDGSLIRLNRGAIVAVEFSAGERRVRLEHGEAAFEVAKDPARPFVVMSAGVAVRAVGTAFNVRIGEQAVDVIVTEGRVVVAGSDASIEPDAPRISAGQRAVIPLQTARGALHVSTPPAEELSRRLAWQPRLLTFTDEPLAVLLNEFNRHNPVVLRTDEPALQHLRLSARFRSDNVQGFLRLLESDFQVRAKVHSNGEIILHSKR